MEEAFLGFSLGVLSLQMLGKKRRREKKVLGVITPSNLCYSSGLGLGVFYNFAVQFGILGFRVLLAVKKYRTFITKKRKKV